MTKTGFRRRTGTLITAAALALLVSACTRGPADGRSGASPEGWHGSLLEPPVPAPDFALTDAAGGTFRLGEQRGKAVLLFFGYTSCPDMCPTELGNWRRVRTLLGSDADRVRFVFVTVDPERDTPGKVGKFVASAGHPSFAALTGDRGTLERVWRDYGVSVRREPPEKAGGFYAVSHSTLTYLISPAGNLFAVFSFGTKAEDMAADVRRLLSLKGA